MRALGLAQLVLLSHLSLARSSQGSEVCEASECESSSPSQQPGTAGLALLQGRTQHGKTLLAEEVDTGVAAACAGEGQDPFFPARTPCCAGLRRCLSSFPWGHSYRCQQACSNGQIDECGCTVGKNGWSSRAQRCSPTSQTSQQEAAACRAAQAPTQTPPPRNSQSLRLMTFNVYFGNNKFDAIASILKGHDVDIANLQETNDRLGAIADASGYVSANSWSRDHDWCGYNFHRGDWSHEWSKEVTVPGSRGVCGALLKRNSTQLCVWGLHPIQRNNDVQNCQESIKLAAAEMKACSSQFNAPSVFMGDFNTMDWRGAQWQLEESTGWRWMLAAKNQIDFIFVQTSPLRVGHVTTGQVVGSGCVPGFPGHNTVTASCGWSDHNPVYADIQLE